MPLLSRKRRLNDDDDVDLTNLIDPLVLLSGLLMLVMPSVSQFHVREAKLAEAGGTAANITDEHAPLIEFLQDGRLLWNQQPIADTQLAQQPQMLPPKSRILLAGDRQADYGTGLKLRSQLQDAGLQVVELTSRPPNEP